MKRSMKHWSGVILALCASVILSCPSIARGSWGPSGCGPVGPEDFETRRQRFSQQKSATETRMQETWNRTRKSRLPGTGEDVQNAPVDPKVIAPDAEWRTLADDPGRFYLYRGGIQVGGWDAGSKRWMDYDAGRNSWEDGYPPWFAHQLAGNGNTQIGQNFFGVDRSLVPNQETFSLNGRQVDFRQSAEAFGDDTLIDDSGKLRITLIGDPNSCSSVASDLKSHPAIASISNKFLVQSYRPGSWPIGVFKRPQSQGENSDQLIISISGPPDKGGKGIEYHSQVGYAGPDKLALAMHEVLRRADPSYQPDKTPDLTKPKPDPAPAPAVPDGANIWMVVLAAITALLFGGKRNADSK